jgi:hypothetical protein
VFRSEELIYIQLQKTASTHIASLLTRLFDGEMIGKHNAATARQIEAAPRFIASIRNPWSWYLSLWTSGVEGRGALAHRLTRRDFRIPLKRARENPRRTFGACVDELTKDINMWRAAYDTRDVKRSFRSWLRLIHDPGNSRYLGEGYGDTAIGEHWGFMTHRYLRLCCRGYHEMTTPDAMSSFAALNRFDEKSCYIDRFIRQETLEEALCETIDDIRPLTASERRMIMRAGKTNTSRTVLQAAEMYDDASVDLIRRRDRLIVEKFGYAPPQ